jgi:hypothetical protein
MPSKSSLCVIGCGVVLICAAILGVGISVAVIAKQDPSLISSGNVCPSVPTNVTSFSLEKDLLSQWHWKYSVANANGWSGFSRLKCTSYTYDAILSWINIIGLSGWQDC